MFLNESEKEKAQDRFPGISGPVKVCGVTYGEYFCRTESMDKNK